MIDLLALAERAANNEERAAVLVLEDALEQAGWLTPANAEKVYDVLFDGWPPARDPLTRRRKVGRARSRTCNAPDQWPLYRWSYRPVPSEIERLDVESSRDWFRYGFASAEICESALSLFGRKFLASIVTVLRDQCTDSPRSE